MATCKYCGKELRCVGGYYYPVYETCSCGGAARESEKNLRACEAIQARRKRCSHHWEKRTQCEYGYEVCTKCGATRPTGGGSF